MRNPLWAVLLSLIVTVPAVAAELAPAPFQDGDVVCFLGDSITHSSKYHGYINAFYLTRFPERKIRFVNGGVSGDSAGGALSRLEWDIFPHKPNVVSIMLGMNDVNRGLYGKPAPDEANLAARQRALDGHRQNMARLVTALNEKLRPRLIFMKPSPYDQTVEVATENLYGVNEALGKCGEYAEELARQHGGGLVDLHTPMTALNAERQKADPKYTLIGQDRVHPGSPGHMVMAYLYLKAQQVPAVVSHVQIDGDRGKVVRADNAEVSAARVEGGTLTFTCRERALPFPVENAARDALGLVPLEKDLNQQILAVSFAREGNYRLEIDGQPVGEYSAAQLKAGINLAFNEQTPQFRQAQEVFSLSEKRRQLEVRLRSLAQVRMMLVRAKVSLEDDAAMQAYFDGFLEKVAPGMKRYYTGQFANYTKTKPEVADIQAQMEQLQQEVWQRNQPRPHEYRLVRLTP